MKPALAAPTTKVRVSNGKYTPQLAQRLCQRLMMGESLTNICKDPKMPSKMQVCKWLSLPAYAEFREAYYHARRVQAEFLVDSVFDIANDTKDDWEPTYNKDGDVNGYKPNNEAIQRSKLKIDTIKWYAGKMVPRIYGEHLDITHDVGGDLAQLLRDSSNKTSGLPKPINGNFKTET